MSNCKLNKRALQNLLNMNSKQLIDYARNIHITMDSAELVEVLCRRLEGRGVGVDDKSST